MHELTLAESVMEIVEKAAEKAGVARVTRVRLSIGALSHVESDTLLYCCEVVSRGGIAEGARFEADRPSGKARCHACEQDFLLDHLAQGCPLCSKHDFQVLDGEQMRVVEIGFI